MPTVTDCLVSLALNHTGTHCADPTPSSTCPISGLEFYNCTEGHHTSQESQLVSCVAKQCKTADGQTCIDKHGGALMNCWSTCSLSATDIAACYKKPVL